MKNNRQFLPLYFTNIFGVMNDNVLKALVCFVAATWVEEEYKNLVVNAIAASMVLPYVLFSPLAGKLPHFFKKQSVVRTAKLFELPIMVIAILGFYFQNIMLAMSGCLLMGLQSALFSPSKYGLIKDIGGVEGISMGMGGMEAFSFLGMLIGTFVGSVMAEVASTFTFSAVLVGLAILGAACSYGIRADESAESDENSINPIAFLKETARLVKRHKGLNHVVMYLSLFWWLSASIQIVLIIHCGNELGMTPSQTGYLLATMAVGITTGCLVAGRINQRKFLLGKVVTLGLVVAVLLILVFVIPFKSMGDYGVWVFGFMMLLVAVTAGIFKIPLDAEIQVRSEARELNVVLAYFNLVSFIFIFAASATNFAVTYFLSTNYVFLIDGIVMAVWSVYFLFNYRSVICYSVREAAGLHYSIRAEGKEVLKTKEGENLLILPMHRALLDPIMLFGELYDIRMQPMVDSAFWNNKLTAHVLGLFDAVQVPDMRVSRTGVEQVQKLDSIVEEQLKAGANIVFYPSGHVTLDGSETIGNRRMAYNAAQILPENTRVIGVRILGLWGSKWSNYGLKRTPNLLKLLMKSLGFVLKLRFLFVKKREVRFYFEDITDRVREWRSLSRQEFNKKLEEFYRAEEDELVLTNI